jgi:hypothetical protein
MCYLNKQSRKSQTRREAETESHGSRGDSQVASEGEPGYFFVADQARFRI